VPRNPHARRCGAHNRAGKPCGRYACPGGRVCPSHGGMAPQVRRAAEVRTIERRMRRDLDRAQTLLREALADWQTARIMYAAQVLDVDPQVLLEDLRRFGWLVGAALVEWPAGLAHDDKPELADYFPARRLGPPGKRNGQHRSGNPRRGNIASP
jgi:hypothetical protein